MKKFILFILLLGVVTCRLNAQFVYENRVYSPLIKAVMLHKTGDVLSQPVISLQRNSALLLEFDELREDTRRYEYTLIHCNSDWTQSKLDRDLYVEGFDVQPIENYENSFNTVQRYVHYSQTVPSGDMRLLKSGNYIIKVFTEGNPDNVVFTRRMYVAEDCTETELEIKPSSDASLMKTHQEVNVRVSGKNGMFFSNPEQFMKVIAVQNGNEYSSHQLKMRGMSGNKIDYSFDQSNQFFAGNDFRFFDMTSLRLKTQYIAKFDFQNGQNQVYLLKERIKSRLPYSYDKDLNGKFYIRNEYGSNPSTESDYAWVHFFLPMPQTLEGTYYVLGDMNNWRADANSKMNFADGQYHVSLYLKQGYYNYQILFRYNNDTQLLTAPAEGNFSETNNVYTVYVYYHDFSDDYDRLLGTLTVEYNR